MVSFSFVVSGLDVKEVRCEDLVPEGHSPTHALLLSGPGTIEEEVLITN